MRTAFALLAIALLAPLPACAQSTAPAAGKMTLSKDAWAGFESYKAWLTPEGDGYFAVANDGAAGWSGFGCPDVGTCQGGPSSKSGAIAACEKNSGGVPCVIFARNLDPVVPYDVAH